MPRMRKLTNGRYLRALVHHLPKSCDDRRASDKPDGCRRDDWVLTRHATRHQLGAGTIVLSKQRRNAGPKGVQILGTNLTTASAGAILSLYAWRWGVEVTIKARQSGLHLGQMQVTTESTRVERSVVLSVLASLLLVRVYGRDEAWSKAWSLAKLKERAAPGKFEVKRHGP